MPLHLDVTDGSVRLRPFTREDAPAVVAAVTESLAELLPFMPWAHRDYGLDHAHSFLGMARSAAALGNAYDGAIVDVATGTVLGGCGLNSVDHLNRWANLGYWVRTSATGRGVATAAARLAAGWGFAELGLHRVEIIAAVDNVGSRRVAEHLGAVFEGVRRNRLFLQGEPHDAAAYGLIPGEV